jgi:ceramide glucosyltransferase
MSSALIVDIASSLSVCAGVMATAGAVQALAGLQAVRRFGQRRMTAATSHPPITVLKPLHGAEPLLEEALATFCVQDYPEYQIVFGLQDAADPALHVLRRLVARFPCIDIKIVIDPAQHGCNRKIGNLINMYPAARHDVIVIADSDIHVAPDYLSRVANALSQPGAGLVTTLYAGIASSDVWAARLGVSQINHTFLPGALMARALGRRDCLGATMALTREMLDGIGGFHALVHHLADDAVLGQLVAARGYEVALAMTVPATTVPEQTIQPLFEHELRWARTINSIAPVGFALSSVQFPLFWASLAMLLSGGQEWGIALFGSVWLIRALVGFGIDRALALAPAVPIWLLPFRDLLSVAVILASYGGSEVAWRGHVLSSAAPRLVPGKG